MKLSLNWISDFVDISNISPEEIMLGLTRSTCEVEGMETVFPHLEKVIVAQILERKPHPDADRLSVCKVSTGKETHTIVCGAPNADAGLLVPLALPGTSLPAEGDKPFVIKTAKIRGVESGGMLCAASELELAELFPNSEGLLVLATTNPAEKDGKFSIQIPGIESILPGTPISDIIPLTDTILEIDNKSITHRPDLWSHFGFAREIAVIFNRKILKNPLEAAAEFKQNSSLPRKKIDIEGKSAIAYYGVHCSGAHVGESPMQIQSRLLNVGQKPINNLVDASNYLMFEVGQPNHIFDAASLKKDTICVKAVPGGEAGKKFTALDENVYQLPAGAVLICDGSGKDSTDAALAGIIGGESSGVNDNTKDIFIESATFHRKDIRRTLSGLSLRTESAVRFEKGQDPAKAKPAIFRLMELLKLSCPNIEMGDLTGAETEPPKNNEIKLSLSFLSARLGFSIESEKIVSILNSLGFETKAAAGKDNDTQFTITVPTYRSQHDVSIPEDIVEEIGRIHGYDNIKPVAPQVPVKAAPFNSERKLEREIKKFFSQAGEAAETNNYSFLSENDNDLFKAKGVKLKNPLFADRPFLRVHLFPGILKQGVQNQDRFSDIRLFEFGRVNFSCEKTNSEDTGVTERKRLTLLHIPPAEEKKNRAPDDKEIFQHFLKQRILMERLFDIYMPGSVTAHPIQDTQKSLYEGSPDSACFLHPGCAVEWRENKTGAVLGITGIVNPIFERRFDLKRPACSSVLYFNEFFELHEKLRMKSAYTPPSIYPESHFELTVVVDKNESSATAVNLIQKENIPELTGVTLLTVYSGSPLPENKKALSYRITLGRKDGTLAGERMQEILEKTVTLLGKNGMPLR